MEERLHKVLAAAGVASRREAERLIAAGHVRVDGKPVTQLGVKVDPERQRIEVDGRTVTVPRRKTYVLLNKPAGYVTTRADPHAPRTVMDLVSEVPVPVHPVGRLDKDTEGALILTNDGEFTQLLTHPRHEVPKLYQAHVRGVPDEKALERLRTGVRLEEGMTAPARVRVLHTEDDRAVLEITLREGRKRQVRRMLEAVGHPVTYLRRVAIGPVSVRKLPLGAWRLLSQKEVSALRKAAESGAPSEPAEAPPERQRSRRPAPARRPESKAPRETGGQRPQRPASAGGPDRTRPQAARQTRGRGSAPAHEQERRHPQAAQEAPRARPATPPQKQPPDRRRGESRRPPHR